MSEQLTLAALLAAPRTFTYAEMTGIRTQMAAETAKNPRYLDGLDAVGLSLMLQDADYANRVNADRAAVYPGLVRGFDMSRIQAPEKFPLSLRPKPAKKLLVGLSEPDDAGLRWPELVQTGELVCDEIPLPPPPVDKYSLPLTISIGPENRFHPGEYQALPDDNAPEGYVLQTADGHTFIKRIFKTPFGNAEVWQMQ